MSNVFWGLRVKEQQGPDGWRWQAKVLAFVPKDQVAAAAAAMDAAVVVAISDYTRLPDVRGATRNSVDWYNYFTKVRKVPARRVVLLEDADATPAKIRKAVLDAVSAVREEGRSGSCSSGTARLQRTEKTASWSEWTLTRTSWTSIPIPWRGQSCSGC